MLLTLASFLLPPLFVFGVYHLLTWFNVFRINDRVFWKRVAITSAICHVLLVSGFFAFSYIDAGNTTAVGIYLVNRSIFWRLMTILDTAPLLVIIGLLAGLDRGGVDLPGVGAITVAATYLVGC